MGRQCYRSIIKRLSLSQKIACEEKKLSDRVVWISTCAGQHRAASDELYSAGKFRYKPTKPGESTRQIDRPYLPLSI